jgi:hypothetical protein
MLGARFRREAAPPRVARGAPGHGDQPGGAGHEEHEPADDVAARVVDDTGGVLTQGESRDKDQSDAAGKQQSWADDAGPCRPQAAVKS